jgi:D-xylose 1-dehydrogenase (NADP+, D-xylono-1,5-lactone-forming)
MSVDDARVEPVRWGLLSTARINDAILQGAAQTDGTEIVAVASRDQRRADDYAEQQSLQRAYGSYDALLEDDDVEVVYVSLPNSMHVEWSIRGLEAGKHVLCEKPMDKRPDAVERAFDAADRAGLLLMEAFMYRHHPQTHKAAELVADGAIGELRQLRSSFSFTLADEADVRMLPELDGGALMDLGCYCVSMQRLLGGEPERVVGLQRTGATGVDVGFTALLQFAGNVFGEFSCGFDLPETNGLEALGSGGVLVVPDPVRCRDPHVELNGERIEVDDVDRYRLQVENFSAAVRGEAEPLLGRADAVAQARALAALYRSAESGRAEAP